MAERNLVVRLRAEIGGFRTEMLRAAQSAKGVGDDAEKGSRKASGALAALSRSARDNRDAWDTLGNGALIAGGAIVAGLGLGLKKVADFDQAMSGVNAALPEAGAQMDQLRQLAITMGADTQFSATEAAYAITELGKAGVSAEAIMGGGLKGALDLAAAGQMDVAEAAETAASAMTQFGLSGADVPHVADLLAAAAGKAQGSVHDMGMALNQVGLVANQAGLTIEETTGALASFASAGLIGSDAGTSFKVALQRLTAPTKEAQEAMNELGISAYDSQGRFVGLANFSGQLHDALAKLTPQARNAALATIFGTDAIRAASVLYEEGADGIQEWIDKTNDAGFAAEQARKLTDNLRGDIERLGGSIDSTFVQNGSGANSALRGLVQGIEDVVDGFNSLPAPIQQGTLGLTAMVGVGGLAVGGFAKVVTTVNDMGDALSSLEAKGGRGARGLAAVGRNAGTILAVATAATVAAEGFDKLGQSIHDAGDAPGVEAMTARILDGSDPQAMRRLIDLNDQFWVSAMKNADKVIPIAASLNSYDRKIDGTIANLDAALASMVQSGNAEKAADYVAQMGLSSEEAAKALPAYSEALRGAENQTRLAAGGAKRLGGGLDEAAMSAEEAKEAIDDLSKAIETMGGSLLSENDAARAFEDAIDSATEAARENGAGLDISTKAGRDNQAALDAVAQSALEYAAKSSEAGRSAEVVAGRVARGREAFIRQAQAMGVTRTMAEQMADAYGLVPDKVETMVRTTGLVESSARVLKLRQEIRLLNGKTVTVEEAGALYSQGRIDRMRTSIEKVNGKKVTVQEVGATASGERVVMLDGKIRVLDGKTVSIGADTKPAFDALNGFLGAAASASVTVNGGFSGAGTFATGGYTGSGSWLDPAGIVHAGEFVHPKAHVDRPGALSFHADLWRTGGDIDAAYRRHKLRGYASGGHVGHAVPYAPSVTSTPSVHVSAATRALTAAESSAIGRQMAAEIAPVIRAAIRDRARDERQHAHASSFTGGR